MVVDVVDEVEVVVQIVLADRGLDLVGLVPQEILDLVVESHRWVKPLSEKNLICIIPLGKFRLIYKI